MHETNLGRSKSDNKQNCTLINLLKPLKEKSLRGDRVYGAEEYRLYLCPSVSVNVQIGIEILLRPNVFEGRYHTFMYINKIKKKLLWNLQGTQWSNHLKYCRINMCLCMQPQSKLNMHRNDIWRMYFSTFNHRTASSGRSGTVKALEKVRKIEKKKKTSTTKNTIFFPSSY